MTTPDPSAKVSAAIGRALSDQEPAVAVAALAEAVRKFSATLSPAESLRFCRAMNAAIKSRADEVSAAILASVNNVPGKYPGFTIISQSGRASVDTVRLAEEYPEAFEKCVTWGTPFMTVALPKNQNMQDDAITAAAKKGSVS